MFLFCTNEINLANISSKHLSKSKPALLNLINQLNNYSNEQNNEIFGPYKTSNASYW